MKKKLFSIVMAATLLGAFGLSGCGSSSGSSTASTASSSEESSAVSTAESESSTETNAETAENDLLAQIKEKGEITIATEGTWAPWTYHDENDELVGFDIEVAKAIADKIGVSANFVEGEWDGLLAGIESGRYDIMANGVEVTEERAAKYDFSDPYAYARVAVIVSGDNTDINSFEDLSGKNTANTISSTYAAIAESYGANVTGVDDLNQTLELLLAGRIDATLNDEVTFYDYMKAHPDANLKVAALSDDPTLVCIPMRKGGETASLREAINGAIEELRDAGTLSEISEKYFGVDITNN